MVLKKDVLCLNDCYAVHDERRSRSIARKKRKSAVVADDSKFQKRFGYLVRRKLRTSLLDGSSPCSRRCTIGLSGDRDRCRHLRNALRGEVGWEITLLDPHQSAKGLDAILFTDSKTVNWCAEGHRATCRADWLRLVTIWSNGRECHGCRISSLSSRHLNLGRMSFFGDAMCGATRFSLKD